MQTGSQPLQIIKGQMVLGLHHNNALDDLSRKGNVVDGTVVFQYFMLKVLQDRASEMLATRLTILNDFLQR